jgi:hypothetical protein
MTVDRRSFLTLAAGGVAVTAAPAILLAQPAQADAALLTRAYETLHPGLYRYASPRQTAARFARFGEALAAAPTLAGKYLALSRLLGTIRCGHTYANFYNQSDSVAAALFAGSNRLPFRFRWLGTRMIVTADTENIGLAPGTEILAIDGRPAAAILSALLPLARADGSNDAKRRALLGVEGRDGYESFDVYYPLLFPMRAPDFALTVRPPGGGRRTLRVAPIDLARRRALRAPEPARDANPGWTLEYHGPAAVMTMANWGIYSSTWDWRGWLRSRFEAMARRGSRALVLDLRANEGGLDCGHAILAHCIDRPLDPPDYERRVRFREAPQQLRPYLDTWDRSFDRLGADATDLGNGFLRLPSEEGEAIRPQGPRFAGRLIVLIGPQNSSATFQFANLVRTAGLGTLIGATTGGNRRGINGGAYYFVRLPESGLEVDLPLIGYYPTAPRPDAGIAPDLLVEPTAADIALGRDPVLARALALAGA